MAFDGRKYDENFTWQSATSATPTMATTGKVQQSRQTMAGRGHTLGLNPVPNRGKGTAVISQQRYHWQ